MDELTWKIAFIEELQALCVKHNKRIDFINFAEAATQYWSMSDSREYTPKQAAIDYYSGSTKSMEVDALVLENMKLWGWLNECEQRLGQQQRMSKKF